MFLGVSFKTHKKMFILPLIYRLIAVNLRARCQTTALLKSCSVGEIKLNDAHTHKKLNLTCQNESGPYGRKNVVKEKETSDCR